MKTKLLFFLMLLMIGLAFCEEEILILDDEIPNPYTFELPKNPVKAGLLSTFIPGAGQIYNERYFKAGGVIAVQTSLVCWTFYLDSKMKEYRRKRNNSVGDEKVYYDMLYHDYFDRRQSFIYWVATSVFLSAMEAFVDAHLINFNEKKNEVRLMFDGQKLEVTISF